MPHSYLTTKTDCCKFVSVSTGEKLSRLSYKIRKLKIFYFDLQRKHFNEDVKKVANNTKALFLNVLKKFGAKTVFRRVHQKSVLYDVNSSKLTKKQKRELKKNQLIIHGYKIGMSITDLSKTYRTTKTRIKQLLIELFNNKPNIMPIRHNHPPHMNAKQINELKKIVSHNDFHLGAKELAYRMKNHTNPDIQVNVCHATIRKYLKRERFSYSSLKVIKRPNYKKKSSNMEEIRD